MVEKTSRTSKIAAIIVVIVNLLVIVLSTLLFTLGIWTISSPKNLHAAIVGTGNIYLKALLPREVLTIQLGVALVAVAIFILFVSTMGFYGALNRSTFLLFMYSTLVLLLLLLECALLYYFTSDILEKGIQEQDGQWGHMLRLAFRCCENNTSSLTRKPSWSCCGVGGHPDNCTLENAYKQSCRESISKWLDTYQTATYVTLIASHVVLASCALMRRRI
ncbi:hypothetical protein ACJJTC_002686 [Scirpophaga incertulas]